MNSGAAQAPSCRRGTRRRHGWRLLCTLLLAATATAGELQHPLELRALVAPEEVLAQLPDALQLATTTGDQHELALLHLAEANACRVIADWRCQRNAGAQAREAAGLAGAPLLVVRGLILESRALIALQDYNTAESLLADAQARLVQTPSAELSADIQLALSSLSLQVGKLELGADYARRGLAGLAAGEALPMQARLHRNLSNALVRLGDLAQAQAELEHGVAAAETVEDPKLQAELHLAAAMLAARMNDRATQRRHIDSMLELAEGFSNSQLYGQGREALATLFLNEGDSARGERELRAAAATYQRLRLKVDEQRANQALIELLLKRRASLDALAPVVARFIEVHNSISADTRAEAADDFQSRIEYAEQRVELARLENEARLAAARAAALIEQQRLAAIALGLGLLVSLLLAGSYLAQRRSNRRLRQAVEALRDSDSRIRDLLHLSPGAVLLHDLDGRIELLNPAAAELLGCSTGNALGQRLEQRVAESQRAALLAYLRELRQRGEAECTLRIGQHGDDNPAVRLSGRVSRATAGRPYAVSHAIDVTDDLELADQLRDLAQRDALTGCFNRRYLHLFADAARADARWAAINIDLDRFKQINDSHGHDRGDQVLREIAGFFQDRLRDSDALVRVGGDEFLILLSHADENRVNGLLHRLYSDRAAAPCGYSLGFAIRQDHESLEATLARADADMYERRRAERGG